MATETDKVKTGALGTLVAVGLFATLSIMLAVTALVRYSVRGVSDQRQELAHQPYRDLRADQTAKLSGQGTGRVPLPIERAKAKVLSDLARDPTSATPPAPVQPAAVASAAVAGEAAANTPVEGTKGTETAPAPAAPAPAAPTPTTAPAPTATHAAVEKKVAPAATVTVTKPAPPTTAAAVAPAPAPASPKPTDG